MSAYRGKVGYKEIAGNSTMYLVSELWRYS